MEAMDIDVSDLDAESVFLLLRLDTPMQFVLGMVMLVATESDQQSFDVALRQPSYLLDLFSSSMGEMEIQEKRVIPELDDIADASAGLTFVFESEITMRADLVAFRNGPAAAMVMSMYLVEDEPFVPIREVALRLDYRIDQALQTRTLP